MVTCRMQDIDRIDIDTFLIDQGPYRFIEPQDFLFDFFKDGNIIAAFSFFIWKDFAR